MKGCSVQDSREGRQAEEEVWMHLWQLEGINLLCVEFCERLEANGVPEDRGYLVRQFLLFFF